MNQEPNIIHLLLWIFSKNFCNSWESLLFYKDRMPPLIKTAFVSMIHCFRICFYLFQFSLYVPGYKRKYSSRHSIRIQDYPTDLYPSVTFRSWNAICGVIFSAVGAEYSRANKWSFRVSFRFMSVRRTVPRPYIVRKSSPLLIFKSQQLPMHSQCCFCQNISRRSTGIHLSRNIKLPSRVQQRNRFRKKLQWR